MIRLLLIAVLIMSGCSKREHSLTTGQTVAASELAGWKGDTVYSVVRSDAIPGLYDKFRSVLGNQGLVKWDARFDCNRFAGLFIGVAQAQYAAAAWHSESHAQSLALAEVWYRRDAGGDHAIVQAATEAGDAYIEPQTGRLINLSDRELASVFLRKW